MAKYDVKHICGHNQEHELFGKNVEREKKLGWLATQDCKECWVAEKRAAEKGAPLSAEIIDNVYVGAPHLIITAGDSYSIKDELKQAGLRWMEYVSNNDLLGMRAAKKAWGINLTKPAAELDAAIKLCVKYQIKIVNNPDQIASSLREHFFAK